MDRDLLRYLAGESNVTTATAIISREKTNKGMEYIRVIIDDEVIYQFWYNPDRVKTDKPKHTGGKKPYVMLMVDEVEKLRSDGVKNVEELIGFLACLGKYTEWGTGKVINKRSKKPLKYSDLQKLFTGGKRKLDRILGDLREHDLLFNTTEGYFIAQKLIKKGAARNGR